jgi:hypothetical protein
VSGLDIVVAAGGAAGTYTLGTAAIDVGSEVEGGVEDGESMTISRAGGDTEVYCEYLNS